MGRFDVFFLTSNIDVLHGVDVRFGHQRVKLVVFVGSWMLRRDGGAPKLD